MTRYFNDILWKGRRSAIFPIEKLIRFCGHSKSRCNIVWFTIRKPKGQFALKLSKLLTVWSEIVQTGKQ